MISYFNSDKSVTEYNESYNYDEILDLKYLANKNNINCILTEGIYNISYMNKLKEISESQIIGKS